jgi:hypothetical protein
VGLYIAPPSGVCSLRSGNLNPVHIPILLQGYIIKVG